jgi:hypothetical protein
MFRPNFRLAHLLRRPGGITIEEALNRSTERLGAIRERCVAGLDAKIDVLAALFAGKTGVSRAEVFSLASEIFSISALFEVNDVAHASGCLCDLLIFNGESGDGALDLLGAQTTSAKFWNAVLVHIDALRRLRQPQNGGDSDGRADIVSGLRQVARLFIPAERALGEDLCDARVDALADAH